MDKYIIQIFSNFDDDLKIGASRQNGFSYSSGICEPTYTIGKL